MNRSTLFRIVAGIALAVFSVPTVEAGGLFRSRAVLVPAIGVTPSRTIVLREVVRDVPVAPAPAPAPTPTPAPASTDPVAATTPTPAPASTDPVAATTSGVATTPVVVRERYVVTSVPVVVRSVRLQPSSAFVVTDSSGASYLVARPRGWLWSWSSIW
jgi:hypothetical protein